MLGKFEFSMIIQIIIIIIGTESLTENSGLNFTLSMFVCVAEGFEDPFSCSRIMWTNARRAITIGRTKCNEKKRFSVG